MTGKKIWLPPQSAIPREPAIVRPLHATGDCWGWKSTSLLMEALMRRCPLSFFHGAPFMPRVLIGATTCGYGAPLSRPIRRRTALSGVSEHLNRSLRLNGTWTRSLVLWGSRPRSFDAVIFCAEERQ